MNEVLWLVLVAVAVTGLAFSALAARRGRRRAAQGPAELAEHLERGRAKQELEAEALLERHRRRRTLP